MASARPVGAGFFPLDEELALLPGSLTPALHEQLVRLGAWMPFGPAAKMLVDFMRLTSVSAPTARRHTEAAGAAYVACQTEAVERLEQHPPWPTQPAEKLCFSVDGAMVPLNNGEWAEAKTLVIGEVQPVRSQDGPSHEMTQLSYFSRLTDHETFERLALVETHRRGLTQAKEAAAVVDGAEWIQGFIDYHRPDALRILDFPHAAEYLNTLGALTLGDGQSAPREWFTQTLHPLKHEGPTAVWAEWQQLQEAHPDREEVQKALAYLDKRLAQMHYPGFQAAGWPIGSGAVESANKLVVEARLKGSGMRWARPHVDPMLALRNVVCGDRWAEAWEQIAPHLRQQAHQRRRIRSAQTAQVTAPATETVPEGQPLPAAVKTPTVTLPVSIPAPEKSEPKACPEQSRRVKTDPTPWRPAPNHPWRRLPIGKALYQPATSPN